MCLYLYMHNKYTQYTIHICKLFFILDAINRTNSNVFIYLKKGHSMLGTTLNDRLCVKSVVPFVLSCIFCILLFLD